MKTALHSFRAIVSSGTTLRASWPDRKLPADQATSLVRLDAALAWLCRAQDAVEGGGVSYGYGVREGWLPPYPETTGYIICTFLEYARRHESRIGAARADALRERARRMGQWLTTVQLESGALPGGTTAVVPRPTVFNTGQILQGWCRIVRDFGDDAVVRGALERAARWLVSIQDPDGCWRSGLSPLTLQTPATYNARAASALLEAGGLLADDEVRRAAIRNFDWVLTQQCENGWFANNDLTDNDRSLTHTIGYTMEGLLDAAEMTGEQRFLDAVVRASAPLAATVGEDGFLPGRFDSAWSPAVDWNCLTGASQIALVWFRLGRMIGDDAYAKRAARILGFVKRTQRVDKRAAAEIFGAIKGSHPVWGGYDPFRYPNWASKFFADALMLEDAARP